MLGPAKLLGVAGPGFVGARDDDLGIQAIPPASDDPRLVLWLKSDEGVGLVGGELETWADGSLWGNNIEASNPATRAIVEANWRNGRPIIRGDNSRLRNAQPLSPNPFGAGLYSFVGQWSTGNYAFLGNLGGPPGALRLYQVGADMSFQAEGGPAISLPAPEGQDFICFVTYDRSGYAVMQIYVGGEFFGVAGQLAISFLEEFDLLLGNNNEGGLAELAFYNQTLTATERRQLFNYYRLAWDL